MTERLTDVQALVSRVALRRLGQPDDVADVAEFLVKATYVTGQVRSDEWFPLRLI